MLKNVGHCQKYLTQIFPFHLLMHSNNNKDDQIVGEEEEDREIERESE